MFSIALTIIYAIQRDNYHLGISAGSLLIPVALYLFFKVIRIKPVYELSFIILAYAFIAFPLGACVDLYKLLPGFDKLAHTLSGTLSALLCLILFYALKPSHEVEKSDFAFAAVFVFFGSMTVAGLWEIGEYALSSIIGRDLQRVLTTGVSDTMQDMIVAMIGTLAFLPCVKRVTLGKSAFLTGAVEVFIAENLRGKPDAAPATAGERK